MQNVVRWVKPEDYKMLSSAWPKLNQVAEYCVRHGYIDPNKAVSLGVMANDLGMNRANLQKALIGRPGFVSIKTFEGHRIYKRFYYIERFYRDAQRRNEFYPREFSKLAHLEWALEIDDSEETAFRFDPDIAMPVKLPTRNPIKVQCVDARGHEVEVLSNVPKLRPVLDSILANIQAGGQIDVYALDQCLVTLVSIRQLLSENINNPEFKFILDAAFPLESDPLDSEATNGDSTV